MPPQAKKTERDFLFWSGGKDSFLALRYVQEDAEYDPILLTTFDDETGRVPHQNIPIETIRRQALELELILFTIPLSYPASNNEYLSAIRQHLEQLPFSVNTLIFGDLHLQDIREWREQVFHELGYKTRFPIWQKTYPELWERLEKEPVEIRISGVKDSLKELISPGDLYDAEFRGSLPKEIDKMGENGEFHTEVIFSG